MSDENFDTTFDMDDPEMLYNPYPTEFRAERDATTRDVYEREMDDAPITDKSSTPPRVSEASRDMQYPNLQVTQNMIQPKKMRRIKSSDIDCAHVLRKVFGKDSFKGKQKEVMEAAVQGADILVVAPTGMGKSMCFQVPAVAEKYGVTLVVSPLLSLMKDQVAKLYLLKIPVRAFTSETVAEEREEIVRDLASGHPRTRLLYITPEKLCSSETHRLIAKLHDQGQLNRLVIDEAHCISEWGTDFRQDYRKLGTFRDRFPTVPIMALTASATPIVQEDIVSSLKMSRDHFFKVVHPFNRPNLFYEIQYIAPSTNIAQAVAEYINKLHKRRGCPSTGIVYCRTKAGCDEISHFLRGQGIGAKPYHRGLSPKVLEKTLHEWESEGSGVDVVCATVAFGMGIDKSDVRYVIHADLPKSFEGYYQETGRAGRDGEASKCILFYSREDAFKVSNLVAKSSNRNGEDKAPSFGKNVAKHAQESLAALIKFAESTTTCRHVSICRFFGEVIDTSDVAVAKAYCDEFCDICKSPEKTRERKKALSSDEYVSTQRTRLEEEAGELENEQPFEPPPRIATNMNLPGFRKASDISRPPSHKSSTASGIQYGTNNPQGSLPRLGGMNGAANKVPGAMHVKRAFKPPTFKVPALPAAVVEDNSVPEEDLGGGESPLFIPTSPVEEMRNAEKHSVEPSSEEEAPLNGKRRFIRGALVPSSSSSSDDEPQVIEEKSAAIGPTIRSSVAPTKHSLKTPAFSSGGSNLPGVKKRDVLYPAGPPRKEKMQEDPAEDEQVEDLEAAVKRAREGAFSSDAYITASQEDVEDDLEAAYSQKIPISVRQEGKQRLRRAIWAGLKHGVGEDGPDYVWEQLGLRQSRMTSSDARRSLCAHLSKQLEFYVFGLSATKGGYEQRIDAHLTGVETAFGPDARSKVAWLSEDARMQGTEDDEDEKLEVAAEVVDCFREFVSY